MNLRLPRDGMEKPSTKGDDEDVKDKMRWRLIVEKAKSQLKFKRPDQSVPIK